MQCLLPVVVLVLVVACSGGGDSTTPTSSIRPRIDSTVTLDGNTGQGFVG